MASSFDQTPEYRCAFRKLESWGVTMRKDSLRLGYARPWLYSQIPSRYDDSESQKKKIFPLTDEEAERVTKEIDKVRDIDCRYGDVIDYYFIAFMSYSQIASKIKKSENWVSDAMKTSLVWLSNRI